MKYAVEITHEEFLNNRTDQGLADLLRSRIEKAQERLLIDVQQILDDLHVSMRKPEAITDPAFFREAIVKTQTRLRELSATTAAA